MSPKTGRSMVFSITVHDVPFGVSRWDIREFITRSIIDSSMALHHENGLHDLRNKIAVREYRASRLRPVGSDPPLTARDIREGKE